MGDHVLHRKADRGDGAHGDFRGVVVRREPTLGGGSGAGR
jgi:hypothetical protein